MAKFVELNEAAKMLGLTPERLVEMRSNGDIHGYRDGSSWKFKEEEIDRVAAELGAGSEGTISFGDDVGDKDDASILVSEEELGHSGESTSSTVIGKSGDAHKSDSDLKVSGESDLSLVPSADTDLNIGPDSDVESDVHLVPGVGTNGDVTLVPDAGSDPTLAAGADSIDGSEGSGGTGRLDAFDSDMSIGSSDLDVTLDSELALSDDDEVVLGGSGIGSDLTLGAADSGINLSAPSDSGLSLEADSGINLQTPTDSGLSLEEEPLDLGGSSISSLELPEDEEVIALEEEPSAQHGGQAPAAAVKKDEEFLLSPSDDMFGEESDSGSQVIALEDSEAFDEDTAGLMQPGDGAPLAETAGLEQQLDSLGGETAAPQPGMAPASAMYAPAEPPEVPYSIWNLLGLLLILMFLSISGVLMTDIVQNMWAWEEARDVSTSISEGITAAIGL
ncbi:MAG: helix-turn-helix domain-containing protein [Pirellulaceae bacterium]